MSRPFDADRLETGAPIWANETTDPSAGTGIPAPVGSTWVRNGNYPTAPTQIYFKTAATDGGWALQNLVNLRIFNIAKAPYNCIGDGVTDCGPGIALAISDAQAAGGGGVYFPPAVLGYAIYASSVPGQTSIFPLDNKQNLTFFGDGYNSWLKMTGDFGGKTMYAFEVKNQSQRIAFCNFRLNGQTLTNPNAADENHYIQITTAATDVSPPHDVAISMMWFDPIVGAAVRMVGDFGAVAPPLYDVRYAYNAANMADASRSRSVIEVQRAAVDGGIHDSWFAPTGRAENGQQIDYEPAGSVAPSGFNISGNIFHCTNIIAVTLSGISGTLPSNRNQFARNIVVGDNGGTVEALVAESLSIVDNIITVQGDSSAFSVLEMRNPVNILVAGNLLYSLDATGHRAAIKSFFDAGIGGSPDTVNIVDNLLGTVTDATNIVGFSLATPVRFTTVRNLLFQDNGTSPASSGIQYHSLIAAADWHCVGNLVVATGGVFARGIDLSTSAGGAAAHNVECDDNMVDGATNGIHFDTTGAGFVEWRSVNRNNCVVTNLTIQLPVTNVGVTQEGNAGLNAQIATVATTPNGNVTAAPGSLVTNTAGTVDAVISYKESGLGATGWVTDGAIDFEFGTLAQTVATAARFLAPGVAMVTESTVEIKMAMPRPGVVRNLRLAQTPGTGGGTNSYTVRKNGVNTSVGLNVSNTAATGTGGANTASFVAGDLFSLTVTKGVAPASPATNVVVTMELTG